MKDYSFITNSHPEYIESLYRDYLKNPDSIDSEIKKFFDGFDYAIENNINISKGNTGIKATEDHSISKELAVYNYIRTFKKRGHLIANTNPIRPRKNRNANLEISHFGLSDVDLNTKFESGKYIGMPGGTLQDIQNTLHKIYAANIGIEYTYINNPEVFEWVEKEYEAIMKHELEVSTKQRILEKLNEGVIFEKFLHTKFIGQKRFSLEGGESTIPALDFLLNCAADEHVKEVVIGMAHRGRLNVLANTLLKTYNDIFNEFEGTVEEDTTMGSGDVKYHLGFRSNIKTFNGKDLNVQLVPNPSHLETVAPVVIGFSRAKADIMYESNYDSILPIIIHGDSSIAGQGVVYEVAQMSNLKGYYVGGSIHFVINNQIGFTTDFDDARSADYCTSLASMTQSPVLHINGDDPEAVVKAVILAVKFRQTFNTDIYLDMVCYRKHGHNEGDDPKFTQPDLYAIINNHKNPRELYTEKLLTQGGITAQMAQEMEDVFWKNLQDRLDDVKQKATPYQHQQPELDWKAFKNASHEDFGQSPNTYIDEETFHHLFHSIMTIPETISPLRKINALLETKTKLLHERSEVDWATGELMAYASLLQEGFDVRISGQDVQRGTFSHRHAVIHDEKTNENYNRLKPLETKKNKFRIYNSLLSEYGVLGFEFGYAIANPNALTIWEAQFGDFVNGAQIIVDQYISSSEMKWNRRNGLVMLLPHGYEGQGPEHSSARMERFLQACAELNMIITNCTTSANFFHALRRQLKYNFRKPLINFSPKANLRSEKAYSHINEFILGKFNEVYDDKFIDDASQVRKVLLCSGKIYFELLEKQQHENIKDIAIVRLEQLYPLPQNQLDQLHEKYKQATWIWVQEEPRNMGAAAYLKMNLENINIGYLTRNASAATATGYHKKHQKEQEMILNAAFS